MPTPNRGNRDGDSQYHLHDSRFMKFDYVWYWRKRLPHRKGQACRVLIRGKMNSILIEFEDGECVVTSRYAVRKKKE